MYLRSNVLEVAFLLSERVASMLLGEGGASVLFATLLLAKVTARSGAVAVRDAEQAREFLARTRQRACEPLL